MQTISSLKKYVDVGAVFSAEGRLTPLWIIWEDERRYEIDRVLRMERAASRKAGGMGIRYTCMVRGKRVHLYYEENYKWFVEAKQQTHEGGKTRERNVKTGDPTRI